MHFLRGFSTGRPRGLPFFLLEVFQGQIRHAFAEIPIPGIKMRRTSPKMCAGTQTSFLRPFILKRFNHNGQIFVMVGVAFIEDGKAWGLKFTVCPFP